MSALSDALARLAQYNLNPFNLLTNAFGLTGTGGTDTNLEPMLGDIVTVAQGAVTSQSAAAQHATSAGQARDAAAVILADVNAANDLSIGYRDAAGGFRNEAEDFRDEAQAALASLSLPAITGADAGKHLAVNPAGNGYIVAPAYALPAATALVLGGVKAGGTNITIALDGTISATGGLATVEVTGTAQTMAVNARYIANNASRVALTLPSASVVGDTLEVIGKGAGGWRIAQGAGQAIRVGNGLTTSAGTGDGLSSPTSDTSVRLVCTVANTTWNVESSSAALGRTGSNGYLPGGTQAGANSATIRTYGLSSETSGTAATTLTTALGGLVGANNATVGLMLGGSTAGSGAADSSNQTTIQSMALVSETVSASANALSQGRNNGGALSAPSHGYDVGGLNSTGRSTIITKVAFADFSAANIAATLPSPWDGLAGVGNTTAGWLMGGFYTNPPASEVQKIVYATDARTTITATLDASTTNAVGINSTTKGYNCGGSLSGGSHSSKIEDLNFTSEASTTIAATLSSSRVNSSCVNSDTVGFVIGGSTGSHVNTSDKFTFGTETRSAASTNLAVTIWGGNSSAFQSGGYL